MMHHGPYRILERLVDEVLDERRHQRRQADVPWNPQRELEQEVKLLYARGDIGEESYRRLLRMARSGELSWDDLEQMRREQAPLSQEAPVDDTRRRDAEIVRALNRLYSHRTRLDEQQVETEQVLERLEADMERLRGQAETAAGKAQLAMPDETVARAYLETKQEAEARIATLEARVANLRRSLGRIRHLRDELATREAELKALESTADLAELEAQIREDLLDEGDPGTRK